MGMKVQNPLDDRNRLYTMVHSGSKGSNINISQIMAVVGQQNLCGQRIPDTWTDRTLPHFKRGRTDPNNGDLLRIRTCKDWIPTKYGFTRLRDAKD